MNDVAPVLLAILDGWGVGDNPAISAIAQADTPNMDRWQQHYPYATLVAHNGAVGLPEGQMGNSEVGHLNIGAGRIVYQDFTRINMAIANRTFFENEVLAETMDQIHKSESALHLVGLVSDGGVHSHLLHLIALLEMAAQRGVKKLFIHAILDGRDTPPDSGVRYMQQLQDAIARIGLGRVAVISGRYYAMDRDNRWDRVHRAWQAMVDGEGGKAADSVGAVRDAYDRGETDEFVKPIVLVDDGGEPVGTVQDGDSVIFFNFRADRARELTHAFTDAAFDKFACPARPALRNFVTFTRYDKQFDLPMAFPPQSLTHILGEEVSRHGLRQLRIAETEKYAHVTYFFNGGIEEPFPLEDRALIPSPRQVATYDQKPEMSAFEVTDELLKRLDEQAYSLVVLNFANGDMVGHTGIMAAAVKACEAVDQCLGRVVAKLQQLGGIVIVTSDHGNAETMIDPETGGPFTAHSSNPVPFILISDAHRDSRLRPDGALTDIAPTILELMGLPIPEEMNRSSLIEK